MRDSGWSGPGDQGRMPTGGVGFAVLFIAIGVLLLIAGGMAIWIVMSLVQNLTSLA